MKFLTSFIGHRGRSVLSASFWSLVAKIAAAANVFIALPFVLSDLGGELFGAWATLVSFSVAANFLDFGFGYGAMNLAAAASGRGKSGEIRLIARAGATALMRVAIVLTVFALIAIPVVPWHRILGLGDASVDVAREAAAVMLFSIALAVPLNLSNRLQLGVGHGGRAFRWQTIGHLLALSGTLAVALRGGSLPACVAATVSGPLISAVANTVSFHRTLGPAREATANQLAILRRSVRRDGMQFFLLQLAAALAYSIDLPLLSALRGPNEAGQYAIVQRAFSVIPMALSLVWAPLWPAYRQAIAAHHLDWAQRTLRRSSIAAIALAAIVGTLIALLFQPLTQIWLHRAIESDAVILSGFVAWCILEAAGTAVATFLNASGVIDYQVRAACVFAVMCIACKYAAVRYLGAEALPWVAVTAYLIAAVFPFVVFRRRIFSRVAALHAKNPE